MPRVCSRCHREVYFAEQRLALGKVWHTLCFSCKKCRKLLDSSSLTTHNGEIFCKACCARFLPTNPQYSGQLLNNLNSKSHDSQVAVYSPCKFDSLDCCCCYYKQYPSYEKNNGDNLNNEKNPTPGQDNVSAPNLDIDNPFTTFRRLTSPVISKIHNQSANSDLSINQGQNQEFRSMPHKKFINDIHSNYVSSVVNKDQGDDVSRANSVQDKYPDLEKIKKSDIVEIKNDFANKDEERMRGGGCGSGGGCCRSRNRQTSCCEGGSPTRYNDCCPPQKPEPCCGDPTTCGISTYSSPCFCRTECCPPVECKPIYKKASNKCFSCTKEPPSCGGGGCCGGGCRGGCGKPGQICLPAKPCSTPPCQSRNSSSTSPCSVPQSSSCCKPSRRKIPSGASKTTNCTPTCFRLSSPRPPRCNLIERVGCECFGGGPNCQRCSRKVYQAEMQFASGVPYHNICFSCFCCRKPLEPLTYQENCGEIYCKQCYVRNFGPQGYGYGVGAGALQTPL